MHKCKTVRAAYKAAHYRSRKLLERNNWLRTKYGINNDIYNQMFADQEGKCKICSKHQSEEKVALAVDHCHETGKIRGLLCDVCNRGIGYFKEDIESLQNAIDYLKENK